MEKNLVINCGDYRLRKPIARYLMREGIADCSDALVIAGAAKHLMDGIEYPWQQIKIYHTAHHFKKIILINHTDCVVYGGNKAFKNFEEEKVKHIGDMKDVKKKILERYPDFTVNLVLADIRHKKNGRYKVYFEEIE